MIGHLLVLPNEIRIDWFLLVIIHLARLLVLLLEFRVAVDIAGDDIFVLHFTSLSFCCNAHREINDTLSCIKSRHDSKRVPLLLDAFIFENVQVMITIQITLLVADSLPLPHSGVIYTEFKLLCCTPDLIPKYLNLSDKIITIWNDRVQPVVARCSSSVVTWNGLVPSWSQLPPDVIYEIAIRLPNFKDIKAISGVCKSWRSACLETTSHLFPSLMLSETLNDNSMRHFFNLYNNRCYQIELSTIGGKRIWASPQDYVVALGPDYETHLEHLNKRVRIALPPLNTIRRLAAREEWFRLVHKFIIFKDPSSYQLSFLVLAIFGPVNRLAFSRVREAEVDLNGRGQGEWIIVANPNDLKFKDVARFKDQLYGLCDNGTLVRFELDAPWSAGLELIAPQPQDVGEPQKLYLVESLENLYGVFRYGFYIPSENRHVTIYFLIYKFNFSALHWEEVTDLEDHAVFVGDGNSWCIPTSSINIRSNTIYFTDDNWDSQMLPGVAYGGCDVGLFDMEKGATQRLPFGMDTPLYYSRPIWVKPCFFT